MVKDKAARKADEDIEQQALKILELLENTNNAALFGSSPWSFGCFGEEN